MRSARVLAVAATLALGACAAQTSETVRQGGDFLWPVTGLPSNYNVLRDDGDAARDIVGAVLPEIMKRDERGAYQSDPDYLRSAAATVADPRVVVYRLDPRAVWSNGRPLDWTDFEAQWEAMNGTDRAYVTAGGAGYDGIASVAPGATPQEVVVTYRSPDPDWASTFLPLYPRETTSDPAVFASGWEQMPLTSAGPFRLDRVDAAAGRLTVVRNERWWGTRAKLDRIVFLTVAPDAQPAAFSRGALSFTDVGPEPVVAPSIGDFDPDGPADVNYADMGYRLP